MCIVWTSMFLAWRRMSTSLVEAEEEKIPDLAFMGKHGRRAFRQLVYLLFPTVVPPHRLPQAWIELLTGA